MEKFFGDEKVKQIKEPFIWSEKKLARSEINYRKT